MRRRELITLLGSAAVTWPFALRAQQKAMPLIGFLGSTSTNLYARVMAAFHYGLAETGYVEGKNLVGRQVEAIAAVGNSATVAAKGSTSTIPIVFGIGGDPIELGLVASLARPGGNLTGITIINDELIPKRFELISELVPQARVIALLVNPDNPGSKCIIRDAREAVRTRRLDLEGPKCQHRERN